MPQGWERHRDVAAEVTAPLDLVDGVAVWTTPEGLPAARLAGACAEPVLDVPLVVTTADVLPRWIGAATLTILLDPRGDGGSAVLEQLTRRGGPVVGVTAGEGLQGALFDADHSVVELPAADPVTAAAVALLELLELAVDERTGQQLTDL